VAVNGYLAVGRQHAQAQGLPELTADRFLASWQADSAAIAFVALLGGAYVWGVLRLRLRGERWPVLRSVAFVGAGLGTIVFATMSGLAVYNRVLFWPAAVQNILLDLLAPVSLAFGDPLSLAYRALPAAASARLRRVMRGRVARFLTFPLVSPLLVLGTELSIFFTPYFGTALRNNTLHQVMYLHLLFVGCLFVLPILTREEMLPSWCSHPVRAALVFVDSIFDAIPGVVVMTSSTMIAGSWYAAHPRTWGPSRSTDQMLGGGAMLTLAELVGLPFLIAVFMEWMRAERTQTAELDKRLDAELERVAAAARSEAADLPPANASPDAPPAGVGQERVRPWWETDPGIVGQRFRATGDDGSQRAEPPRR
jgi:putative copper resistance protein D